MIDLKGKQVRYRIVDKSAYYSVQKKYFGFIWCEIKVVWSINEGKSAILRDEKFASHKDKIVYKQ